ncbi:hypothetical protein NKH77_39415 [Streptomyces sp. M19]
MITTTSASQRLGSGWSVVSSASGSLVGTLMALPALSEGYLVSEASQLEVISVDEIIADYEVRGRMSSTGIDGESATGAEGYHARAGRSSGDPERDAALQRIMTAARELGLATISLNSAVARSMEIHPTDAWILSYLQDLPPRLR